MFKADKLLNSNFLFIVMASLFIYSCSQNNSQGLLSKASPNSCLNDPTMEGCTTNTNNPNALQIYTANQDVSVNINSTDLVEITGICDDLGKFNNRIIVQVFADAGEGETYQPYLNNEQSKYCQYSNNPSQSGLEASGLQCLFVTKGLGLTEGVGTSEKLFPQCHNGQYGFSVRLGKVLNHLASSDGKPYLDYRVRFKLVAIEPSPALPTESEWMRVDVRRGLDKPSVTAVPEVTTNSIACTISSSRVSKFNLNILYSLERGYTDAKGYTGASAQLYSYARVDTPVLGGTVLKFIDNIDGLPEGITYTYRQTSFEGQYSYIYPLSEESQQASCTLPPPSLIPAETPPTANQCFFRVVTPNTGAGVFYEYGYSTIRDWSQDQASDAFNMGVDCSSGTCVACGGSTCNPSIYTGRGTYYFAVRARKMAPFAIGKWSQAVPCNIP